MIRVAIIAETHRQAQALAQLLSEDDRLEISEARAFSPRDRNRAPGPVDVILAASLKSEDLPAAGPPVVVLTDDLPEELPFTRTVRAWLPGDVSPSEISTALLAAASELTLLTPSQVVRWLHPVPQVNDETGILVESLTPRELEVLRMLSYGMGNKEIAAQLNISDHTAKFHVAQILGKLGAASRTEAVAIGIRRGLVPI